jgi:protein ImuB
MKRVVSLWLPTFATDRLHRRRTASDSGGRSRPLATVIAAHGGIRIAAVDDAAKAAGIVPGLTLADARAQLPDLMVAEADAAGDRRALEGLADWCGRYTPWTAVDEVGGVLGDRGGGTGLWLDISGCAHLFGGERELVEDLVGRLAGFGFAAAAAVADTAGGAWAMARFTEETPVVVPPGDVVTALPPLPMNGLRLPPKTIEDLSRVGLRRIGDLAALPRTPLAARFGDLVLERLDQAFGRVDEPLSPRRPPPAMHVRLAFAEPVGRTDDIALATGKMLDELCARLAAAQLGVRGLELVLYRTDGTVVGAAIGTSRPVRDPDHLQRLFREKLDGLDPGFGVEVTVLAATVAAPLAPAQTAMGFEPREQQAEAVGRLIDRLGNRLGPDNVIRLVERASHVPERACRRIPALAGAPADACDGDQRSRQPRPLHLLPWPEPIEVMAPVPDGPPVLFRWRRAHHRVAAAEGPERIEPEWWRQEDAPDPARRPLVRDYYRVEDAQGHRFWIYREGFYRPDIAPRWYLHGLFP